MTLVLDGSLGVSSVDGSASTPALQGNDSNTGVFFPAADTVGVSTGGTERMRVDSNGNVGIGTSSPGEKLVVAGAANVFQSWRSTGGVVGAASASDSNSWFYVYAASNHPLVLGTNNAERMRIDSSGNVGIGTSSPNARLAIGNYNGGAAALTYNTNDIGGINGYYISDGNRFLDIYSGGAPNGSAGGSTIRFLTTAVTASTFPVERMRLDASGNLGIATNAPATPLHVNGTIRYTNRPAAGTITAIGYDANGDLKNSSSSLRYKYDINDYGKGLAEVMQLRPVSFKFNGEERENIGYIAEEVDALGLKEVMLYDEQDRPDGVLYANMVALLTKAIQEQQQMINDLKAEVQALKDK